MAKLTKSELKSVFKEAIKECLQEIIAENSQLSKVLAPKKPQPKTMTEKKISPADSKKIAQNIVDKAMLDDNSQDNSSIENPMLVETVNNVVDSISQHDPTKADVMRDILADTAATTLQEQHEIGGVAAGSAQKQDEVDVESLKELSPNGDMKRWAQVALAKK